MSKWLKLSEIPKDFWGECFIAWDSYGILHVDTSIVMIRNFNDQGVMWYCESLKEWFDFRQDLEYRLMIVEFPSISEEDFK